MRRLRALWAEGRSASEVAAALGVSRNAVIGKVHRLGLSSDGRHAARPGPTKRTVSRPTPPRRSARRPPRALAAAAEILPGLVPHLEHLAAGLCRWPIGDPRSEGFAFCGRCAARGPYCEVHATLAYAHG